MSKNNDIIPAAVYEFIKKKVERLRRTNKKLSQDIKRITAYLKSVRLKKIKKGKFIYELWLKKFEKAKNNYFHI